MNYGNSFRFEILRSKQVFQEQKRDLAGFAFMNPDEDFYTLKLLFLPGISYYLVRQKEKDGYYTISDKPGFGIELDRAYVAKYKVR